jgi:hypothetical protein
VRSNAQRAALHSAHHCTAPSTSLRTALHCQRCTVRNIVPPPPASPLALHSAQHYTAPSTTLHRAQRAKTRPIAASEPSIYSAQPYTVPSATQCSALHSASLRPALHCAQCFTARSVAQCAALYSPPPPPPGPPPEPCIARTIAQRPALHCTEHSEPRQGRSQQANQARCAQGVCCVFFVRLAPMKTVVRTPELAPCAKKDSVLYSAH